MNEAGESGEAARMGSQPQTAYVSRSSERMHVKDMRSDMISDEELWRARSFFHDHSVVTTMTVHMDAKDSLVFEDALLRRLKDIHLKTNSAHGEENASGVVARDTVTLARFQTEMDGYMHTDGGIEFPRWRWQSDETSLAELRRYFNSIEDFPDISVRNDMLVYTFSGSRHCIRYSRRVNELYPGCGAMLIGPVGGRQPPTTRESLNFFHLINYVCSGTLRYGGMQTPGSVAGQSMVDIRHKWYTTNADACGRFDCREEDEEGHPIALAPLESFQTWILRNMGLLQHRFLNK